MARLSQSKQLGGHAAPSSEHSDNSNIIVAPRHQPQAAQDNDATPSRLSTRIPKTILPIATPPARPTVTPRVPDVICPLPPMPGGEPVLHSHEENIHSLRIRNAVQRTELLKRGRDLRRLQKESDGFEREATEAREQNFYYRNELRATRIWMEVAVFIATLVVVCVVLYVGWCWVNSAEFEFQRKVLRRNLGLD